MNTIDRLKELAEPAVGPVMEIGSEIVLDGTAGAMVPGVGNLILAYKQKRTEKNLEDYVSQIVDRQEELNERLNRLDPDKLQKITGHYFGLVTDYALDVKQQEKIHFIVNGYVRITEMEELNADSLIMFYDTLDQMSLMDLAVLKSHSPRHARDENNRAFLEQLVPGQRRMIHEKLLRLGLLNSQNEKKMDDNVKHMAEYLQDVQKGKKNAKLKYDRLWGSDSYHLSEYGRSFLEFFMDRNGEEQNKQ